MATETHVLTGGHPSGLRPIQAIPLYFQFMARPGGSVQDFLTNADVKTEGLEDGLMKDTGRTVNSWRRGACSVPVHVGLTTKV